MRKTMSPFLTAGVLINIIFIVTNRFIVTLPDGVAIPVLLLDVVLVFLGMGATVRESRGK